MKSYAKVSTFVRALALVAGVAAPACGDDADKTGDAATTTTTQNDVTTDASDAADALDADDAETDDETFVIGPLAPPVFA